MLRALFLTLLLLVAAPGSAVWAQDLQSLLQTHADEVEKPGRKSVGVVLEDLLASGLPGVPGFLEAWQDRKIVRWSADGAFYVTGGKSGGDVRLLDVSTGEQVATAPASELAEARPNGGVRREIASALVRFQLSDPDPDRRQLMACT